VPTDPDRSVSPALLGRPRRHPPEAPNGPVRVELRLRVEVAVLLFDAAESSGHTVSRVGADALKDSLMKAAAM
jgi:hypothetical protein